MDRLKDEEEKKNHFSLREIIKKKLLRILK